MIYVVLLAIVAIVLALLRLRAVARLHREKACELASVLLPEIRAILASSDPRSETGGAPAPAEAYARNRDAIGRSLPADVSFAVETFYGTVEAYDEARRATDEAFREESRLGLGDRIRAKDRRDRLLKDLYDSGASATEKLEALVR